jgi:hypothetical protein
MDNQYTISVDPGVKNIGLAVFRDKTLVFACHSSLKNPGNKKKLTFEEHISGIRDFVWGVPYFRFPNIKVIVENNDVACTQIFAAALAGMVSVLNGTASFSLVFPQAVTRWGKLDSNRVKKKKQTGYLVKKWFGKSFDSLDVNDAILNFVYEHCRISKIRREEIKDATFTCEDYKPDPIDTDECGTDWDKECEVDTVPSGGVAATRTSLV